MPDSALTPLMVTGFGRSGSTALMSLLTTDPEVGAGRAYPLEERILTYLAKLSLIAGGGSTTPFTPLQLFDYDDRTFGSPPFFPPVSITSAPSDYRWSTVAWFRAFWVGFSSKLREINPRLRYYAEKTPAWVPPMVRTSFPSVTIYLFRDPRDVYLSTNAFMKKRQRHGFFRSPDNTDLDHARNLAFQYVTFFENYYMDGNRDDCLLVRYEDLILRPEATLHALGKLGLTLAPEGMALYLEQHRTTADPVSSVDRWRRDPIPDEVRAFLEDYLSPEMRHLGYEADVVPLARDRFIDFSTGNIESLFVEHSPDGEFGSGGEHVAIRITGADFWVILAVGPFQSSRVHEIWLSVQSAAGDHCSIYWRGDDEGFSAERSMHVPCDPAPHWRVLRFPLSGHALWRGRIAQLRLDAFNSNHIGETNGTGSIRWLRLVGAEAPAGSLRG